MKWLRLVLSITRVIAPDKPVRCTNCNVKTARRYEVCFLHIQEDDKWGVINLCGDCFKGRLSFRQPDPKVQAELYVNIKAEDAI